MAAFNEEAIFQVARQIDGKNARRQYLDQVCETDLELQGRLDALLRAYDEERSFLERPAVALHSALDNEASTVGYDSSTPLIGTNIADRYKLLEQIGEGGMGTVWMAQQTEPVKRVVAVKLIKAGMDSKQVIARFEAERQALALMDHPNIAKVLDGGVTGVRNQGSGVTGQGIVGLTPGSCLLTPDAGRPFFVMELVKGMPITKYCDEHRLTPRQRLELFIPVCNAIQHAHQKGIIHRDLKPSNVLIALYDGRPVPKVIDFGVAKAAGQSLTERTLVTGFGAIVGTLEYMSPEQAEINQLDIDTRSDIYSLGVLLYELLAGTTPLERKRVNKSGMLEALRIIREEELPTLSNRLSTTKELPAIAANRGMEPAKLTRLVRGDLDWIVMKALEKDRNRRYETANGFAMDVQRYLADEPVLACRPSTLYRFGKFARRNRREVLVAGVAAVAGLAGVTGLWVSRALIANALSEAKDAQEKARVEAYFHRIALADRELSADNLGGALKYLGECPEDLRQWEWHYLKRLCRVDPLVIPAKTEVNGVAFSPTGDRLASAGGDGTIKIWNSKTAGLLDTFPAHSDSVISVAFHPDGKHLASRSRGADLTVKVWDLTTDQEQEVFTEKCGATRPFGLAYTIAFSPNGRHFAAATDKVVKVWDWKNRQHLHDLPGHDFHTIPVAFSPDGRLATGTFPELKLWDPETGEPLRTIPAHEGGAISALAFSADGKWLASASYDRTVKLWDATTGGLLYDLLHPGNQVECVAISRDGRRLASGCEDKTVRVWDTTTGREILVLRGHTDKCGCVAFSPDGYRLASASFDGTIRIWDGTPLREDEPRQETLTFTEHNYEIRGVAFSPDGPDGLRVASASNDGFVMVWDAQTGRVSAKFSGYVEKSRRRANVFSVAWHPKGHRIASGCIDAVRVWDARTEQEAFRVPPTPGKNALPLNAVAFSTDGRYLLTGSFIGGVQVWDAETGQPVGKDNVLDTPKREIRALVFSPKGGHLASASGDGIVKLWDATRLNEKPEPRILPIRARVPGPSVNVAFSPDGRRLATGGKENTVKIWDVQTGKELQTLEGHRGEVYTLAFSPADDGRWIASAGEDSTVKVWDSHTGKVVRTFRGHTGLVCSVAFSPDGQLLVSGSRDYTVKLWDVSKLEVEPER